MTKEKILGKFIDILPEYNLKSESTYKRIVRSCLKALLRTYDSFLAALLSTFRMQVRVDYKINFHFIPTKKPARVTSRFKFYFLTEFPNALTFFVSRSR